MYPNPLQTHRTDQQALAKGSVGDTSSAWLGLKCKYRSRCVHSGQLTRSTKPKLKEGLHFECWLEIIYHWETKGFVATAAPTNLHK